MVFPFKYVVLNGEYFLFCSEVCLFLSVEVIALQFSFGKLSDHASLYFPLWWGIVFDLALMSRTYTLSYFIANIEKVKLPFSPAGKYVLVDWRIGEDPQRKTEMKNGEWGRNGILRTLFQSPVQTTLEAIISMKYELKYLKTSFSSFEPYCIRFLSVAMESLHVNPVILTKLQFLWVSLLSYLGIMNLNNVE